MRDRVVGLAVAVLLLGAPWRAAGTEQTARDVQEATDWPTVIATLQRQLAQWPSHVQTRQQLAVAYNNYGVALGDQGQWELAARQLQEALRLDEQSQQFRTNLSAIYVNQARDAASRHQSREALALLDQALTLDPGSVHAYVLRGEIEYDRQRLKEAKAAWERALELDPGQGALVERLRQVSEELPVESQFEQLSQMSFDLRYEEALERPVGFDIRDALLEARRLVGSHFAYWPKHKIVVLIYSAEQFRALRQETPEWVAGQFDGKIRVPMPSAQLPRGQVKQIVFHEYTHALIHDLTNGRCPLWLNEGLAEYEGRTQAAGSLARLAGAVQEERLIPWGGLSDSFAPSRSLEQIGLAYEQAYSVAAFLIERYSFWRIRRILSAVAEGTSWEEVLSRELRMKLSRLEANWRDWLPRFLQQAH